MTAALFVVGRCVKQTRIQDLCDQYPDALLLPVLSKNKLPLAFAWMIGLPVWSNVYLLHTVSRKQLNAFQRLLHKPIFVGDIRSGLTYIIVDDVITQGGTIAALREHVVIRGGKVVAVTALAFAIGSYRITPGKEHLMRLITKFGYSLIIFLRTLDIAVSVDDLTNSQVRYLLRFASVSNMVKKLSVV